MIQAEYISYKYYSTQATISQQLIARSSSQKKKWTHWTDNNNHKTISQTMRRMRTWVSICSTSIQSSFQSCLEWGRTPVDSSILQIHKAFIRNHQDLIWKSECSQILLHTYLSVLAGCVWYSFVRRGARTLGRTGPIIPVAPNSPNYGHLIRASAGWFPRWRWSWKLSQLFNC